MSIKGLIAAAFTPIKEDFSINYDTVEKLAQYYHAEPLAGIFVNGTTGESMSLTVKERIALVDQWIKYAKDDFKIIVHVGHTCLDDCRKMARHAQQIGAFATAAMGPCFFKPATVDDLVTFCGEIAKSAPDLPFYYYHMPSMTGNNFKMIDFLRAAAGKIPNLAGIKYTYEDIEDYRECVNFENGRFNMLFGRDEKLYEGLSAGGSGAVGSTYNYVSKLYDKLIKEYNEGNLKEARKLQDRSIDLIKILAGSNAPELAVSKLIMKYYSKIDCGYVRLPLTNLSKDQADSIFAALDKLPEII